MKSFLKVLLIGLLIFIIDIQNNYCYEQINLNASINIDSVNKTENTINKAKIKKKRISRRFKSVRYTNLPMPKHIQKQINNSENYFNKITSYEIIKLNKRTKDSNRPIVIVHENRIHEEVNYDSFSWIYKQNKQSSSYSL